ncbi:hypothetical protein ECG_09896 [Echinococcus granulosus]|nr:hypothetical protein ECG_09896 [Echinococcus granulosus]
MLGRGIAKVYGGMALILHLSSLQSPYKTASIMRNLPATYQLSHFKEINMEREATRVEVQEMTQFSAAHFFVVGIRLWLWQSATQKFAEIQFICEIPKFLTDKKVQVLKMASQLMEATLSDENAEARLQEKVGMEIEKARKEGVGVRLVGHTVCGSVWILYL